MAGSPNLCDKSWVTDQYDRYVRGNTVLAQPSDSGMIRVDEETGLGVAVSTDCNGRFAKLDPYAGAQLALAESYRNVATGGAQPLAISDCLNFGSPEDPDVMWQFAEACRGLADGCRELGIPVTGGNVSLYNQTGETAILPTPVVAVLGVIDDVSRRTPSAFVAPGERVLLLGETREELSGSEWAHVVHGHLGGLPPRVDLAAEKSLAELLREAVGLVTSAHDLADGGLAQALVEAACSATTSASGSRSRATRSWRCSPSPPGEPSSRSRSGTSSDCSTWPDATASRSPVSARPVGTRSRSTVSSRCRCPGARRLVHDAAGRLRLIGLTRWGHPPQKPDGHSGSWPSERSDDRLAPGPRRGPGATGGAGDVVSSGWPCVCRSTPCTRRERIHMRTKLLAAAAATALVGLTGVSSAYAAETTEVVTESDVTRQVENTPPTDNWVLYTRAGTPPTAAAFVDGPADPPLGNGSLRLTTATGGEKVFLFNYDHVGETLSSLEGDISYSTYRVAGSPSRSRR